MIRTAPALLRGVLRGVVLVLTSAIWFGTLGLGNVVGALAPDVPRRLRRRLFPAWARWSCRLLGIRIQVQGIPPQPPFFLVSNHLGYLDIAVLGSIGATRFVAKQDIDRWPVFRWFFRSMAPIYVSRRHPSDLVRANVDIEQAVRNGEGVVLFPEGTSSSGQSVLPFNPSLLDVAAKNRFPVHHAALTYRTPPDEIPASDAACWWGDAEFVPHFARMLTISCIDAMITIGPQPLCFDDRKQLAKRLERAVRSQFNPVDNGRTHEPRGRTGAREPCISAAGAPPH
jgi:1-acyl-sn-glycerol-3-phosphate acyltransferase